MIATFSHSELSGFDSLWAPKSFSLLPLVFLLSFFNGYTWPNETEAMQLSRKSCPQIESYLQERSSRDKLATNLREITKQNAKQSKAKQKKKNATHTKKTTDWQNTGWLSPSHAQLTLLLGFHTTLQKFRNTSLFLWFGLGSTLIRDENWAIQNGDIWKRWLYGKHFERVMTRLDTLKSGWTHYVYYITHLFSSVFCLILWLLSCILSEDDNLIWSIHASHNLSGIL